MLHRLHVAAMATCAIACDHSQSTTVTIAPTPSSSSASTATVTPAKHAAGETCASDADCAAGLNCCTTGMRGKCGGARMANENYAPCEMLMTCVAKPCEPMSMPPYGGAFPDSLTV